MASMRPVRSLVADEPMLMVDAPMGLPASVIEEAIGAVSGGLPKPLPVHRRNRSM